MAHEPKRSGLGPACGQLLSPAHTPTNNAPAGRNMQGMVVVHESSTMPDYMQDAAFLRIARRQPNFKGLQDSFTARYGGSWNYHCASEPTLFSIFPNSDTYLYATVRLPGQDPQTVIVYQTGTPSYSHSRDDNDYDDE
jgi:hypothetical protein